MLWMLFLLMVYSVSVNAWFVNKPFDRYCTNIEEVDRGFLHLGPWMFNTNRLMGRYEERKRGSFEKVWEIGVKINLRFNLFEIFLLVSEMALHLRPWIYSTFRLMGFCEEREGVICEEVWKSDLVVWLGLPPSKIKIKN